MPGLPDYPIGTKQQVREVGLNPRKVMTCSKPARDGSNPGCPVWKKCKESLLQEGGRKPCYLGLEVLTPISGGGWTVKREILHCHVAYLAISQSKHNGVADENDPEEMIPQVAKIVAREGEEIEVVETKVTEDPVTKLRKEEVKGVKNVVPAYPHPRELRQFQNHATASMAVASILKDRQREDEDRIIGRAALDNDDSNDGDGDDVLDLDDDD